MKQISLVILGFIALLATGCRGSKVVTVEVPRIEKEYITSTDTVHKFDSIYVFNDRFVDRDTVYISKVSERYKYLYKTKTDTLLRTDTITVIDTKRIEALTDENDALKATGYFYRRLGLCLLVIIGMMGLYIFFKR